MAVPDIDTDLIGRFLSRYGEWGWLETLFVASVIPDGARVLDAGAFVGTFGLGVSRARSLAFLCCVEANSAVVPMLRKNIGNNAPCPALVLETLVAGPDAAVRAGQSMPGNLGSMSFSAASDPASPGVRSATLAELRAEHGAFDLIKLDIEGMELEALRGDTAFLAQGRTTLWIEANEDIRSLELAETLLSLNLQLFYFAFPAFNPRNFNNDQKPVFPFAFEAGLLAAPATAPLLSAELIEAGCILKQVRNVEDLKDALWRTPRWGMTEWEGAATMQEMVALVGRSILGESPDSFLSLGTAVAPGAKTTIWQKMDTALADLATAHTELAGAKEDAQQAQALAAQRLTELEAERRRRSQAEERSNVLSALFAEQKTRLATANLQHAQVEEALREMTASATGYLNQLQSTMNELHAIQSSTIWRVTGPLRRFIDHRPTLKGILLRAKGSTGGTAPAPEATAPEPIHIGINPAHRETARPYFDSTWYLAVNQDVSAACIDPLDHFLEHGWREGRSPSAAFDVAYYLDCNPDVAAAGINPLLHYIWSGKTEGRRPLRELNGLRSVLLAAESPRERARHWAGAVDRSEPLSADVLATALGSDDRHRPTIVSISHDDYVASFGGIQNVIADEQSVFEAAGWRYLHLSPAAPLPMLADYSPPTDYRLRLRIDGRAVGVVTFANLAAVLQTLRGGETELTFVFHHLLGHVPELLATLPTATDRRPIVWVHDFFTLCPNFTLLRNDVKFCSAPPSDSGACSVCTYGTARQDQAPRIQAFFQAMHPLVLAPSTVALDFWRQRSTLPHAGVAAVPPARLTMHEHDGPVTAATEGPLHVAHLGGAFVHKGWPIFEQLAVKHSGDRRYKFYHLGQGGIPSAAYLRDPVWVNAEHRNAMVEATIRHRIDVVVCWPLWPETFSFTVHEALAGGAFVVARRAGGNVWPAVEANAPSQGCCLADEASLFHLFESGEILGRVADARRARGTLHPSGNTAEWLLNGQPAQPSLCRTGTLHQ